jgi:integrase
MASKKRGNGEGSVVRRSDGRWMGRFVDREGLRRSVYGRTRADASDRLVDALRQKHEGTLVLSRRCTVEEFLRAWLDSVADGLEPTTYRRYEQLIRIQVVPRVGKMQLKALEPLHVQALYRFWLDRGLSPTTVGHLHALLHRAMGQAQKWRYVQQNVVALVTKPKSVRQEMSTLSASEASQLLTAAKGDRLEAVYVLALSTGMRQGEILALRWSDLDLDRGMAKVSATLQPTAEGLRRSNPKTRTSRRGVQLPVVAIDALRRHRVRQTEERLKVGPEWEQLELVFTTAMGRPIAAASLLRVSFYPLLARAGLPHIRFHDLRHTAATLLLEQGVHPKIVSEMLGHSTIAITLDLYSHVTPTMQEQAAAAMDAVLRGG